MRILHVITGLKTGGAESSLAAVAPRQAARGHDVRVVSLTGGGPFADRLAEAGVEVRDVALGPGMPDPRALGRLARLIRDGRPDVVQGWMYHGDLAALIGLSLAGRRDVTRLCWGIRCSDMDLTRYSAQLRLVVRACRWLSPRPDAVIANSRAGLRVHQAFGYRPRRFEVIPNGIDTDRFRPDAKARASVRAELGLDGDTPVLLSVARVDPMKDHDTLLAAAAQVPGAVLVLAGAGTEAFAGRPGVVALGRREDVPRLLAAADVLAMSSAFGEGFPNVVAEAMACGVPAVVTDVGDAATIVGPHGAVAPPRDPGALGDALAALLARPREVREATGREARARIVEEFGIDACSDRFLALYAALGAGSLAAADPFC